jgi:hypothetical protein
MYLPLLFDQSKVLPHGVWALVTKMVRDLLNGRDEPAFALTTVDER